MTVPSFQHLAIPTLGDWLGETLDLTRVDIRARGSFAEVYRLGGGPTDRQHRYPDRVEG